MSIFIKIIFYLLRLVGIPAFSCYSAQLRYYFLCILHKVKEIFKNFSKKVLTNPRESSILTVERERERTKESGTTKKGLLVAVEILTTGGSLKGGIYKVNNIYMVCNEDEQVF